MNANWLKLATSKDATRPQFQTIHGNLAADGFRVHRDNSILSVDDEVTQRINDCGIIPVSPRNRATVSRLDLLDACKRARALRDDWDRKNHNTPALTFCMNGSLLYSAKNESGSISAEIVDGNRVTTKVKSVKNGLKFEGYTMVYKHHNPEKVVSFALNTQYLLDALSGMEGETVEIDIPAHNAPFYLTDGTREAVIMPISISMR